MQRFMENFATAADIAVDYWFGALAAGTAVPEGSIEMKRWFSADAAIDQEMRGLFSAWPAPLSEAVIGGWRPDNAEAELAAILILDQFPRNMFRGTPTMYRTDPEALALSLEAVARPGFAETDGLRAMFLAMPMMHAEDRAVQARMLGIFEAIAARARADASPNLALFEASLKAARRHHEIVEMFGRFPHRNTILGRPTTPAEAKFLEGPDSSF